MKPANASKKSAETPLPWERGRGEGTMRWSKCDVGGARSLSAETAGPLTPGPCPKGEGRRRSALISAAVTGKIDVCGLMPAEAEAA